MRCCLLTILYPCTMEQSMSPAASCEQYLPAPSRLNLPDYSTTAKICIPCGLPQKKWDTHAQPPIPIVTDNTTAVGIANNE
mmetsp:Transcript_26332/g.37400  ORF Transcript_26332/g.37400 Transcript_26332/m.37400 type:complete len:81 (-) Transcript_26332:132-374(-)